MTHAETCCSQHPLNEAYSPTPAMSGQVVYVICGHLGCTQRLKVDVPVWEAEAARRRALSEGVQVWHARGDMLVPVAPDVDGLVPVEKPPDTNMVPCSIEKLCGRTNTAPHGADPLYRLSTASKRKIY